MGQPNAISITLTSLKCLGKEEYRFTLCFFFRELLKDEDKQVIITNIFFLSFSYLHIQSVYFNKNVYFIPL